jgi:hypothetical protein
MAGSEPEVEATPLRFGVMSSGTTFPAWQARVLQDLLGLEGVKPALLIVPDVAHAPPRWLKLLRHVRRRDVVWLAFSRYVRRRSAAARPVDLSGMLTGVPVMRCRVALRGKFSEYFAPSDVEAIRGHGLDFILRFAFGVIRGEILETARYGVWSFHHDDEERFRGGPPCFWEIYTDEPVTGSILQRLTERLDGGVVLHKGWFPTVAHSYVRNRDAALFGGADWPARVCRDLRNGVASYLVAEPTASTAPIYHNPRAGQMVVFALKITRNFVSAQMRGILWSDQWNVGIVDRPIQAFLEPGARPPVRWFPDPPPGRYIADPFARVVAEGLEVLVEDFDYTQHRGVISAIAVDRLGIPTAPRPAITLGVHASYPFLLEHQGIWYCLPEIADAHEIALFRSVEYPREWERVATLVEGFDGLDPTAFRHDNRWWLFATDRVRGPNTKLWGWYADDLLGPWTPHGANPLKTDVRSARPAGTPFVVDGVLYRPAQDDSATYGGSLAINRVLILTPDEFREEVSTSVAPLRDGPYPDGLHTISAAGARTVIDGKRKRFVWSGSRRELLARVGRLR